MLNKEKIKKYLIDKNGILTTKSAKVYRESYFGNNVIAKNDSPSPKEEDGRGYALVELWIMSSVEADNPSRLKDEGLTKLNIENEQILLRDLKKIAGSLLFDEYEKKWPLTKILDIGGKPVETSFGSIEVPPIPVHVHGGRISNGKVYKPGKAEA